MKIDHTSDYHPRRVESYPPIGDQLDLLYKGFKELADRGTVLPQAHAQWVEIISSVKANFPKPDADQ